MKHISIRKTFVFIIIIGILGYLFGLFLSRMRKIHEGARTLPRPTRHPIDASTWNQAAGANYQSQSMNEYVDTLINGYFDVNGIPYVQTYDIYNRYCVNQGNVDQDLVYKLNDVCYYILNIAIPNIPTVENPNPTIAWPPIQWLSTSTFKVDIAPTNATDLVYTNTWKSYAWQYNNSKATGGYKYNAAGISTPDQSNGSAGGAGGTGGNNGGCGGDNNPCGIQCPTSCFASALNISGSGGSGDGNTSGYSAATDNYGINANAAFSGALNEATRIATDHTNTVIIGDQVAYTYHITDASQNSSATTLNDYIKTQIIDYFFISSGPDKGRPTQKGIEAFTSIWLNNTNYMDLNHKNKLRDLVYYVMEQIIPGLPTKTLAISYVEWKPIRWLVHADT